ncbi:60s ribosomal protein L10 [Forsythia ovata]|uniref:60s ribosomal protein L10 n=1 Tax=Forsythia ovata TaxID=205694 RepID=A0ABD1SN85_9LAMI
MKGAFGKPQGTCTRVAIGQVLLSVRCKDSNSHNAQEALHRAKGFTTFSCTDYVKWKSENRISPDGVNAKLIGCHGPLMQRQPRRAFLSEIIEAKKNQTVHHCMALWRQILSEVEHGKVEYMDFVEVDDFSKLTVDRVSGFMKYLGYKLPVGVLYMRARTSLLNHVGS